MHSRKAVGSLIGIGFLLMILAVGVSYYQVINRIEKSSEDIILEMAALDRDATDEDLEIQRVRLTGGNSLNLSIKNKGNILAELKWIGVFDDTMNTQEYYSVDTSLNPLDTQTEIGNSSISMNPSNTYTIQILTKLGNIYYGEYPEPSAGSGGEGETDPYYSDYEQADLHANTTVGTHTLFGAMMAGPDSIVNKLTEVELGSSPVDDYIDITSNVDGSPDKGNHLDFNLQKAKDGIYDTLTEEDTFVAGITLVDTATYADSGNTIDANKADLAGLSNGDLVIIHYVGNQDEAWNTIAGGFTKVDELLTIDGMDETSGYFYKFMVNVAGEPATWTFGNTQNQAKNLVATVWRGVDSDGYLDASAVTTSGTNDLTPDSPNLTTANDGAMILVSFHGTEPNDIGGFVGVAPAGFATAGYDDEYGGQPNWSGLTVGYLEDAVAGAVVIGDWQNTKTSGAEPEWHTGVFSLVPATATPNYELDLEVQFTSVDTGSYVSTDLCIYTGIGDAEDILVQLWDGTAGEWNTIISDLTPSSWNNYTFQSGDTGFGSTTSIRFLGGTETSDATLSDWEIDAVLLSQHVSLEYYELDLEVLWSGLPSFANEYLMVYGETQGVEDLQIDVWDGAQWVTVVADIQMGWNTVDVSTYLTGSSFNIRFKDTLQVSDSTQENWEIDTLVLNLFD